MMQQDFFDHKESTKEEIESLQETLEMLFAAMDFLTPHNQ